MAILSDDQRDVLGMLAAHPETWVVVRPFKAQLDCRALARLGFAEVRGDGGFSARVTASGVGLAAGMVANGAATKGGA
jgi:chorismate synthase